jgi:hypothetical protein
MIHRLISTTTAAFPTGTPTQDRLFRVATGPFAGRLVAVFAHTPSVLSWSCADPPFTSWSSAADFVTEAANDPCSAVMDDHGNLYIAYTQQATGALRCVKLTFASGMWATQTSVTVYDSETSSSRYPSIRKDLYDRIWIAWTRDDAGTVTLRVKKSIDDGLTFGAGPADAGTDLSGATTAAYGQLIARANHLHCLFTIGGTTLKNRSIDLDAAVWNPSETLYTGAGLGRDLCAAVAPDGTLGVLFSIDTSLLLKEFDGSTWGALQTVASGVALSPSLRYVANAPHTLFLQTIGTNQRQLLESHRNGAEFTAPAGVLSQSAPLATLFCFDADAGTPYADLTVQAAGNTGADVFHPVSGALAAHSGDAVYFGAEDRFSLVRVLLSTVGSGGVVAWSYWNGAEWTTFVPASGGCHFDASNAGVRLFADGASTPVGWQKSLVNNINRYWIRAVVTGPFSTPPIGSQLTAVANSSNVLPLRA